MSENAIPEAKCSQPSTTQLPNSSSQGEEFSQDGWMGWIRGTVQSVKNKVAEKAKSSMDSMITTLDPQMKDFISKIFLISLPPNNV